MPIHVEEMGPNRPGVMTGPGLGKLAGGPGLQSPPNQQNKSGGMAGMHSQILDRIEASN